MLFQNHLYIVSSYETIEIRGVTMEEHKEQKEYNFKELQKEETVTFSKITLWKGVSVVLGMLLVISIFTSGFENNSPTEAFA